MKDNVGRWFGSVRAPMSVQSYERLPRHPAYKFEYWDGQLRITPRWQSHCMFLELRPFEASTRADGGIASFRELLPGDWDVLSEVLAYAFADTPPLGLLSSRRRRWAARDWLSSARDGGEGPLVEPACVVAVDRNDSARVLGALIVTMMVGWTRSWYARRRAVVPPPPPDLADGRSQPQISWVFVDPQVSGQGVATALLAKAAGALWNSGYRELASATDRGNITSMAWHWRNGFRLLPHAASARLAAVEKGNASSSSGSVVSP
jgi:GNAT superfamily N-acetyltransferase